jgi:hypothetical protein
VGWAVGVNWAACCGGLWSGSGLLRREPNKWLSAKIFLIFF